MTKIYLFLFDTVTWLDLTLIRTRLDLLEVSHWLDLTCLICLYCDLRLAWDLMVGTWDLLETWTCVTCPHLCCPERILQRSTEVTLSSSEFSRNKFNYKGGTLSHLMASVTSRHKTGVMPHSWYIWSWLWCISKCQIKRCYFSLSEIWLYVKVINLLNCTVEWSPSGGIEKKMLRWAEAKSNWLFWILKQPRTLMSPETQAYE